MESSLARKRFVANSSAPPRAMRRIPEPQDCGLSDSATSVAPSTHTRHRAASDVGLTPVGHRRIVPVCGGKLWASDCVATSCRTPIDLLIARGDGAFQQDVRLVLQTDGDALILMTYRGIGTALPKPLPASPKVSTSRPPIITCARAVLRNSGAQIRLAESHRGGRCRRASAERCKVRSLRNPVTRSNRLVSPSCDTGRSIRGSAGQRINPPCEPQVPPSQRRQGLQPVLRMAQIASAMNVQRRLRSK